MPEIPIEIIEEILDHLRKDKQTLKVCSNRRPQLLTLVPVTDLFESNKNLSDSWRFYAPP